PRPHERREVKVQQRPIRRAAATARAPRGPGAEAANTARRCLSGDRRASAACSTLLLRLLPGLDLPPCVVPTRITKLPNGVRDSASPPRMSGKLSYGDARREVDGGHRLRAHEHPDLIGSRTWISIFGSSVLLAWLVRMLGKKIEGMWISGLKKSRPPWWLCAQKSRFAKL
uniref:Uncharacterized protein n=1 Tax=Aegilops tauschii subsp. strangulata TaxID=200361 RepID=A0A453EGL8_AEGTS